MSEGWRIILTLLLTIAVVAGCNENHVTSEVEAAVWAFHAADTARNAEAVIMLLWPEFEMLVDGNRVSYNDAAAGSREFMPSLETFACAISCSKNSQISDGLCIGESVITIDSSTDPISPKSPPGLY